MRFFTTPLYLTLAASSVAFNSYADSNPSLQIDAQQRQALALTLYNQDLGLVREQRAIPALDKNQTIVIENVSAKLQANTLQVRNAGDILEQNHNTDLLSYSKLLHRYLGKTLKLAQQDPTTGIESQETIRLLAVTGQQALIERNQQIENIPLNGQWRFIFPSVPADLSLSPSISVRSGGTANAGIAEISYLTGGLSWSMDYVLTLDKKSDYAALNGMATLKNNSGSHFPAATISLLAGSINQPIQSQRREKGAQVLRDTMQMKMAMPSSARRESIQDFYLYTLPHAVDLNNNQQKQVNLLSAASIKLKRQYHVSLSAYPQPQYQLRQIKPNLRVIFNNSVDNNLGDPMPAGAVRVFSPDSQQNLQFIGGSNISHSSQDDEVSIQLGKAFDISISQQQTKLEKKHNGHIVAQTIDVRNGSNKEAHVQVKVNFGQRWKIEHSSHSYQSKGRSADWLLTVPSQQTLKLNFEATLFKQ